MKKKLVRKKISRWTKSLAPANDDLAGLTKDDLVRRISVPGALVWAPFKGAGGLGDDDTPAAWGDEPNALLLNRKSAREALGTDSDAAVRQLLYDLEIGLGAGENKSALAAPVGVLRAMAPKNVIEGMMMAEMLAMHGQTMRVLAISRQSNLGVDDVIRCVNAASSCSAAFREGMEALTRFRAGGKQQVLVSHINVQGGAQAAIAVGGDLKGGGVPNDEQ